LSHQFRLFPRFCTTKRRLHDKGCSVRIRSFKTTISGKELVLADAEGKRSSKGEDFDIWPKGLGRLKVQQLPITNA
jgi:hypothetical protein